MRLIPGGSTDRGMVREGNEDGYVVDRRLQLFAVADGMGGHRAGEVASATALEALRAAIASGTDVGGAITSANAAVFGKAADDPDLHGMGTTLTAVVPDGSGVLVGHVGDSRAYLLRDGELQQLTTDHSLVEELVREGRLTEEQAAVHPQRSIITRALGVEGEVEVDVYAVPLQAGDRLLLCSDGLTTMLRPADIAAVLRRESDPTRAANALVDEANAAGGEDNITTVVIDVEDDGTDPLAAGIAAVAGTTTAANIADAPLDATPVDGTPSVDATVIPPSNVPDAIAPPVPEARGDVEPPTGVPEGASAATELARRQRREQKKDRHPMRSTGRFVRFALPIILILGLAFAVTAWYARRTYYVAFNGGKVTLYQGRPGGVLLWDPTVIQRTDLTQAQLTASTVIAIKANKEFSNRDDATRYVDQLQNAVTSTSTSSTSTTTTTTSVPPGTPVPST